ncbi:hypothetical protein KU73_05100 [Pectobacterium wasabiae]|uniref:Uncharacterized protein n=1 Tax=Pectobacterium wasabiae TaxID=55208 RepID=A0AAW3ELE9_9GAMM|nr:hypothetical protein A7983_18080 [Pectobacterium wasabiae CFBP 3304]KFX09608.1 hypothetical protein JV38_01375 [Pectobacterium wasabiae]KGA29810.1 hypothetical protein KU73_05100 [Pectobacterium wasabiae]
MDILLYAHSIYRRLRLVKILISAALEMLLFGEIHRSIDNSCLAKNEFNLKEGKGVALIKKKKKL